MDRPIYEYFQDKRDNKVSKRTFILFASILICFYLIVFVTNIFFQQSYRYVAINGLSMQPTFNASPVFVNGKSVSDGVYIKLTQDVDYGDIIIIDKTDEANHTIIKRLLGKGGDRISIAKLKINGSEEYRFLRVKSGSSRVEIVNEKYIAGVCTDTSGQKYSLGYQNWSRVSSYTDNYIKYESSFYGTFIWGKEEEVDYFLYDFSYSGQSYEDVKFFEIEPGKIFYMGDNRTGSSDARSTGTEYSSKIIGKVVVTTKGSNVGKITLLSLFSKAKGYLEVVWKEIINIFSWKA